MKAIQVLEFGAPEVMQLVDIATPEPEAGEVLVRVAAAGVNPVDTYIRSGVYPIQPELPFTPGFDGAGEVVQTGTGVEEWQAGDRVYFSDNISGSYAEFVLCRCDQLYPLPNGVSLEAGAGIGIPGAAAWRALYQRGEARPGDRVLVHGASGAAGLAAIELGKAGGLKIYGTAGDQEGRALVLGKGALGGSIHGTDKAAAELADLCPAGFDLIIEMLANQNLEIDFGLLAPRGKVVVVGSRGRIEIDPRATMGKETAVLGMSLFNASTEEVREIHAALGAGLEAGCYQPVISRRYALGEAVNAHHKVMQSGNQGKIILLP